MNSINGILVLNMFNVSMWEGAKQTKGKLEKFSVHG